MTRYAGRARVPIFGIGGAGIYWHIFAIMLLHGPLTSQRQQAAVFLIEYFAVLASSFAFVLAVRLTGSSRLTESLSA